MVTVILLKSQIRTKTVCTTPIAMEGKKGGAVRYQCSKKEEIPCPIPQENDLSRKTQCEKVL